MQIADQITNFLSGSAWTVQNADLLTICLSGECGQCRKLTDLPPGCLQVSRWSEELIHLLFACLEVFGQCKQLTNLPTFCLELPGQCKELTHLPSGCLSVWTVERTD